MPDAGGALVERLGLSVRRHRSTGRWMVSSRELARATAHKPSNIARAARVAERELGLTGSLVWAEYVSNNQNKRRVPYCWIPRAVLGQMRLHNVTGCWHVREIVAEYLRLIDAREERPAEPAPDSEIRPPDPEPALTLEPVPPWQVSWRITEAIDLVAKAGAPAAVVGELKSWNDERRWRELQCRAKSWADVGRLFSEQPARECR